MFYFAPFCATCYNSNFLIYYVKYTNSRHISFWEILDQKQPENHHFYNILPTYLIDIFCKIYYFFLVFYVWLVCCLVHIWVKFGNVIQKDSDSTESTNRCPSSHETWHFKLLVNKGVVQDKLSQYLCHYKRSIDATLYVFIWVYNCYNVIIYLPGGIKNSWVIFQ